MKRSIITLAALAALGAASALAPAPALAGERPAESRATDIGIALGGIVGAVVAGPPGAIAGMALGGLTVDHELKARDNRRLAEEGVALAAERDRLVTERARLQAHAGGLERSLERERRLAASRPDTAALADGLEFSVGFRSNSAEPPEQAAGSLDALALLIAAVPSLEVRLDGYADPRGDQLHNMSLSAARAAAIRDQLVAAGIPESRIRMAGHGAPATDGEALAADPDGWALQRRVDIRLERNDERVVARP